jgi:hypothetical protein
MSVSGQPAKGSNEQLFSGMPLIAAGSEPAGTYVQRQ